jgi:hypothetical protein
MIEQLGTCCCILPTFTHNKPHQATCDTRPLHQLDHLSSTQRPAVQCLTQADFLHKGPQVQVD